MDGWEDKDIAEAVNLTNDAVRSRKKRYRLIVGLPEKTVVYKRKVNAFWGLKIKESCMEDPLLSHRDRLKDLQPPFCRKTMTEYMTSQGIEKHSRPRQIVFTEIHKQKRIQFALSALMQNQRDPNFLSQLFFLMRPMSNLMTLTSKRCITVLAKDLTWLF